MYQTLLSFLDSLESHPLYKCFLPPPSPPPGPPCSRPSKLSSLSASPSLRPWIFFRGSPVSDRFSLFSPGQALTQSPPRRAQALHLPDLVVKSHPLSPTFTLTNLTSWHDLFLLLPLFSPSKGEKIRLLTPAGPAKTFTRPRLVLSLPWWQPPEERTDSCPRLFNLLSNRHQTSPPPLKEPDRAPLAGSNKGDQPPFGDPLHSPPLPPMKEFNSSFSNPVARQSGPRPVLSSAKDRFLEGMIKSVCPSVELP